MSNKLVTLDAMQEFNEKKTKNIFVMEDGSIAIQGSLTVSGTNTTQDTETLAVKDNIIVTNADGNTLIENAGFAVKTNTEDAYGIMYDPVGDGVKIGLGAIDESGKFNYTEGEDQFLATRADAIADGHTVVWDDEKKTLVDSGVDHSEYVKKTDYATADKAGVGMFPSWGGLQSQNGSIVTSPLSNDEIDKGSGNYKPVCGSNFKHAVKVGITTNTETLTDDEKKALYAWIGAVQYYSEARNGIARYINGNLIVNTPIEDSHATTKKYVVDGFVAKPTGAGVIYSDGAGTFSTRSVVSGEPKPWTMVERTYEGRVKVGAPTENNDATTKGYVDNLPDYITLTEDSTDESGNAVQGTKTKWREWLGISSAGSGGSEVDLTNHEERITALEDIAHEIVDLTDHEDRITALEDVAHEIVDLKDHEERITALEEGAGSGGGTTLYKHTLTTTDITNPLELVIISYDNTVITQETLIDHFSKYALKSIIPGMSRTSGSIVYFLQKLPMNSELTIYCHTSNPEGVSYVYDISTLQDNVTAI